MTSTRKPMNQLPIKHQLFLLGMISHKGDKAKAARSAGYSEKTAKQQGTQLFTKLYPYIEPLMKGVVKAYALSANQVVQGLSLIASSDMRDFMSWDNKQGIRLVDAARLTPEQAYCVSEIVQTRTKEGLSVRVKLCDKQAALNSLAQYHSLFKRTPVNKGLFVSFEDGTVYGDGTKTKREGLEHTRRKVEVTFEDAEVPTQNSSGTPSNSGSA